MSSPRTGRFFVARRLVPYCALAVVLGCAKPGLQAPKVSPDGAAQAAITEFDRNGDGTIDEKEADGCPPLKTAWRALDTSRDGKLDANELVTRFRTYYPDGVAIFSFSCQVFLDGNPLPEAQVTLTPEKFLGGDVQEATAVTAADGSAAPSIPGERGAMHCGLFRVRVSKKNAAGAESIPARYNTSTTLGVEVSSTGRGDPAIFQLKSR